jgi:hypothetical protein
MQDVSISLKVIFILITLLTVILFYKATKKSTLFLIIIFLWMLVQLFIGLTNFYLNTTALPPRFALLIVPPLLFIIVLFVTQKGRVFMESLDTKKLTILHTIRIPVEIVLYYLFIAKVIPQEMTFEGRNFDIIAGITAPVIYYFGYVKNSLSKAVLIAWNIICLGLLLNIVVVAILSTATPFQYFGFTQPNIAIAYFPFNWLASVIVPLVLFSHLASLRNLTDKKNDLIFIK